mmetsp:Transcript_32785/g.94024  ORF Transcript_32785/g.94024 Transcript_32785/m.94024 type:complete len:203 (+) Transcript_32785:1438-2046(+)
MGRAVVLLPRLPPRRVADASRRADAGARRAQAEDGLQRVDGALGGVHIGVVLRAGFEAFRRGSAERHGSARRRLGTRLLQRAQLDRRLHLGRKVHNGQGHIVVLATTGADARVPELRAPKLDAPALRIGEITMKAARQPLATVVVATPGLAAARHEAMKLRLNNGIRGVPRGARHCNARHRQHTRRHGDERHQCDNDSDPGG